MNTEHIADKMPENIDNDSEVTIYFNQYEMPENIAAAIGRFVTNWSALECALPWHAARLVAYDKEKNEFNLNVLQKALACSLGTPPSAILVQLENLTKDYGEASQRIRKIAAKIRNIKEKRDEISHRLVMDVGGQKIKLMYASYSRTKIFEESVYTIEQINHWSSKIKHLMLEIDYIIAEITHVSLVDLITKKNRE